MGLIAAVYKGPKPPGSSNSPKSVRPDLGNVITIRAIREELESHRLGRRSVILDQILYSASHFGDAIPLSDLNRLKQEIELIRSNSPSAGMQNFLAKLSELIGAAETESN